MATGSRVLRALLAHPGILKAGPALDLFLLRYLRTNTLAIFVIYRLVLAAIVVVSVLSLPR